MAIFHCNVCGSVEQSIRGNKECCGAMTRNVSHYPLHEQEKLKDKIASLFAGIKIIEPKAHYIQPDIQPYQAMAYDHTGKAPMITSRKEHREFLRRNGYQEIGNEMPKATRQQADHNVRRELTEATREVLAKYR